MDGKKTDACECWIAVVAGALQGSDGRWLMHRRPADKHHGGLWEFPGGKVEPAEIPKKALIRELREELGITCSPECISPAGFAGTDIAEAEPALVILLYTVTGWHGEPEALEGGAIGWFTPAEIAGLAKPPLDCELAERLFQNL
ncbi:(deoxy)nucleoside triphosphate pyrophosphohydrolase [Erythrobacter dokdonensis]|jgi:8-oxo-dGTP diphosphatase|uniref:8-oxo-dGTP diphosphatase n=1 Tax=Erythrobacter dokdonensis DSW-74 TaxID=1300349 RepID=A0A1A7BI18_9SPHN|nr:(deoxy)nucleoside triphosphate pyrophosphohydrolase [Erythrobacter dokdonensis]OBV12203.1 Mutator mutT protein [Erythrobacter dokdonensis DSW-74]